MLSRNILGGCTVALIGALGLAGTASAAPSLQFVGGNTRVILSDDLLGALTSLNVTPAAVRPGRLEAVGNGSGARVVYPIPTGELDAAGPKLEVLHSGGLTLSAGSVRVALTSFIIENLDGGPRLTGIVKVNDSILGRVPLFNLALSQAPALTPNGAITRIELDAVDVTLSAEAAEALNAAFGLSGVFTEGFPIGTARVLARLRDRDG